ncbi:MAG: FAD-dependent oxidoreductase, partial [Betaproteobacteria bacterium]|nr:FAD-dependent oxidoreductase [Betaproteobacteria bacterium]
MAQIDIQVPDIGDFDEVAVIELLVKPGDSVAVDQSLITVESDKASMEIPSSHAGVVTALKVKLGDKVKQGSVILSIEASGAVATAATAPDRSAPAVSAVPATATVAAPSSPATPSPTVAAPMASGYNGAVDVQCDVLVLGGGPGGYSAAFRAADLGLNVVLVERYAQLGGVCLNVGCIPSKALLHVAAVMDEVSHLAALGVDYGKPKLNIDALRSHKEKVIGKLTGGLAAMAKMRKVTVLRGYGAFVGSHHLVVEETTGSAQDKTGVNKVVGFKNCIIAAGSQAVHLPFMPDDPRVVDSTGALQLAKVPKRMLILGGGIIGLEMGTVYSTLGARLDVVEMMDGLMQGADRDLVKVWQKMNAPRFDNI